MPPPRSARSGVLAVLLAAACLLGADFSRPDPATFKLGKTSEQEIRDRFGEPSAENSTQVEGRLVTRLQYAYVEVRSTVIPVRSMVYSFHEGRLVGFEYLSSFVADETVFDEASVKRIKRGETTRAEVLGLVGKPTGQFIYPSPAVRTPGRHADVYGYSRTDKIASSRTLDAISKVLIVTFDDRDVVVETSLVITSTSNEMR
jgi:hypothetical protein